MWWNKLRLIIFAICVPLCSVQTSLATNEFPDHQISFCHQLLQESTSAAREAKALLEMLQARGIEFNIDYFSPEEIQILNEVIIQNKENDLVIEFFQKIKKIDALYSKAPSLHALRNAADSIFLNQHRSKAQIWAEGLKDKFKSEAVKKNWAFIELFDLKILERVYSLNRGWQELAREYLKTGRANIERMTVFYNDFITVIPKISETIKITHTQGDILGKYLAIRLAKELKLQPDIEIMYNPSQFQNKDQLQAFEKLTQDFAKAYPMYLVLRKISEASSAEPPGSSSGDWWKNEEGTPPSFE